MPINPAFNKTAATASYPTSIPDMTQHLKRETNTTPNEVRSQARTINVILLEMQRVMEVLGTSPNWTEGQTLADLEINTTAFGDGSDGDVVIAVSDTLTEDMYYDNLTIETGQILNTDGYRIFVRHTLTLEGTAIISNNGNAGVTTTPGAATNAGSLGIGSAGAGSETNGDPSSNSAGGAGGSGGGAVFGTGGAITANVTGLRDLAIATTLFNQDGLINAGSGGGGGEDGAVAGGAGGGGGGVVMVAARNIVADSTATISANGGDGGNGGGAGDGGGGGGGGGLVIVVTTSYVPPSIMEATGGDGGTGAGGNGASGSTGTAIIVAL